MFAEALDRVAKRLGEPAGASTLIFVAIYTFLWGCWLILFDVFSRADLYDGLMKVASEEVFGLAAVVTGIAMALTVLRATFPVVAYGAALGFLFWGLIAAGYFVGDYQNTGGITAAGVSLYSAFVYLNIRLNQE